MAAKVKANTSVVFQPKPKRKRPGVHSKSKNSKLKASRNYAKSYRGQGH